jgi:hypothetical protein
MVKPDARQHAPPKCVWFGDNTMRCFMILQRGRPGDSAKSTLPTAF